MESHMSREMKRFNHLLGEIDAVYHAAALKMGLSDSAMSILYTISNEGDACLLQTICRRSGLNKQTVNSALRKLERERVIYRESAGPKVKRVCLTEQGKTLARRTAHRIIQAENEILTSWSAEDVEAYLTLTERFLQAIREKTQDLVLEEVINGGGPPEKGEV